MSETTSYGIDALAVGPHPDDVEIFCGGIVATLAARGYRVGILDLTRGELATQGTAHERAGEADAAAKVLGLALRENLGLPDGFIDPSPNSPHVPTVAAALRRLRPEMLLIPWREERHPDHEAASALLTRAVFFAGLRRFAPGTPAPFVPRQVLFYEMRHRMTPSFIVDTTAAYEIKKRAIACHATQVVRQEGAPATLVSAPLALEAIEARDRHRGSQIGVRYGEALRTVQVPGLVDPLAHARANPFPGAHAFEPR